MHYFSLITSDFCEIAQIGLISFFKFNKVTLNLYVVDNNYEKVVSFFKTKDYFKNLNIVNIYDECFDKTIHSFRHRDIFMQTKFALLTLWMFYILDAIKDDECIRIDLDVIYFSSLKPLESITGYALCGVKEENNNKVISDRIDKLNHTPECQINIGICKIIKSEFKLDKSFTEIMIERMTNDDIHYLIPDQDLLNELAITKKAYTEQNIITQCVPVDYNVKNKNEIVAFHFNGSEMKPWELYNSHSINTKNLVFACGIRLFRAFCIKYNIHDKVLVINERYTSFWFIGIKTKTPYELELIRMVDGLIKQIKEW